MIRYHHVSTETAAHALVATLRTSGTLAYVVGYVCGSYEVREIVSDVWTVRA